jgi:hypothetical protein
MHMPSLAAARRSLLMCTLVSACAAAQYAAPVENIAVGQAGAGFVLSPSGAPFTPWGFNYDRDYRYRLIEEYWNTEWATVEQDFRQMKALGANVVRLHLQFAQFMESPDKPNQINLARLEKLVRLAEEIGLYLDITGLGSYRASAIPSWYSGLSQPAHWDAQAAFWEAIAGACTGRPGVFAYNLMNEPMVSSDRRPAGAWVHPNELGGLHYVEFINLNPAGRQRSDVATQWVRQMVQAIRKRDRRSLVTVGIMTGDTDFSKPEEVAGFPPSKIAPEVDYISVHLYPKKGEVDAAIDALKRFKTAKPLMLEETYPLRCGAKELGTFLARSHGIANGWLGFYWGQTPQQLQGSAIPGEQRAYAWLELFQAMDPNRKQ